jgi:23S rRNA (uracil1939-C5)-methyltransferase
VPGGYGLGRLSDGRIVLASRVAPGDLLGLGQLEQRRGVAHVVDYQLLEPGPERVVPACPLASKCGGCDWMHLSQRGQADSRIGLLRDALRRTGGGAGLGSAVRYSSPGPPYEYRQRLRLHVAEGGPVGLLAASSSHVVPVDRCLVAMRPINAAMGALSALPGPARGALVRYESIEVRAASDPPEVTFRLSPRGTRPGALALVADALHEFGPVVLRATREDQELVQLYRLPRGLTLEAPVSAFTQVNPEVNDELVEQVVSAAEQSGVRTFLEPYAGTGNFTLPLLGAGLTGRACDSSAAAISSARRAARSQGLPFDGFDVADAARWLQRAAAACESVDLVLLDPPRHGARDALSAAMALASRAIALVACDPVSLARDLRVLDRAGWHIEFLVAFDMFPQTHHVETLVWLTRASRAAK